jgi:hypothetical protein
MAGKNPSTKKAKELLAKGKAKERDKHEKSSLKIRLPLFKEGNRVWILTVAFENGKLAYKQSTPQLPGTVQSVTGRGTYSVLCDSGVLQDVHESQLLLIDERTPKTGGVH